MEVGTVQRVDIEQTMRSAYLSYAMSVITARALPDVRDGLKPVQRRILYAMEDMGLRHDRPTRKSARIVGEVLGKYHPHGDLAVYEAMVRMAQEFSMRYPLVEGQGNFGSIDGDSAAAIRYTEARLTQMGEELLTDLEKNTVDMVDNFDGTLKEPTVLPSRLPNLLVNGAGGIAVGMATNIPPHNLSEVCDAVVYLLDRYARLDDVSVDDLMRFIKGPDFPTGGIILGTEGIRQAYATGKGRVVVRAMAHIEEQRSGHTAIIVTEIPYQVNKSSLVERIATLAREGRVEGIGDLRDESDRTGIRIVIELKRGTEAGPVMELLLKYTQLQATFGVNTLALVDGEPRMLSLKRALTHYIDHRHQVIERRTRYDLERALARQHILQGLLIALDNLDEVISTIRRSQTPETARDNLIKKFKLSELQAQAILDMQLRRLAALERKKIQDEYEEVTARIAYLRDLLSDEAKIRGLIRQDALDLKKAYGDARRTRIVEGDESSEFRSEDLLPDEAMYCLLTRSGLVRRLPEAAYLSRRTAVPGMYAKERDALLDHFTAHAQESALFFTQKGRAVALPVHQLPDASQQEGGLPLAKLVHLDPDERPIGMVHLAPEAEDVYLCLGSTQGKVKRIAASELAGIGQNPEVVMGLSEGDSLGWALLAPNDAELLIVTRQGKAIRFACETVRPQGKPAMGMRGISMSDDDALVAMERAQPDGQVVVVTAQGFSKRTAMRDYPTQGRGGQGILTVDTSKAAQTGDLAGACVALEGDDVVLVSVKGAMTRLPVASVPPLERASWGKLITRTTRTPLVAVENDPLSAIVRLPGGAQGDDTPDMAQSAPASTSHEEPAQIELELPVATPRRPKAPPQARADPAAKAPAPGRTKTPAAAKTEKAEPKVPAKPVTPEADVPKTKGRRSQADAVASPPTPPPPRPTRAARSSTPAAAQDPADKAAGPAPKRVVRSKAPTPPPEPEPKQPSPRRSTRTTGSPKPAAAAPEERPTEAPPAPDPVQRARRASSAAVRRTTPRRGRTKEDEA